MAAGRAPRPTPAARRAGTGAGAAAPRARAGAAGQRRPPSSTRRRDWPVTLEANGTVTPLNASRCGRRSAASSPGCTSAKASSCSAGQLLFTLDGRNDEANVAKAPRRSCRRTRPRSPTPSASWRAAASCSRRTSSRRARSTPRSPASPASRRWWRRPRGGRRRRGSALGYNRIVAPSAGPRRRDQRLRRQLRAAGRRGAGDDHPARPDRRLLHAAAAQPRRRARRPAQPAACRCSAQLPDGGSRRSRAGCSSSTTPSTRRPATVQGQGEFDNAAAAAVAGRLRQRAAARAHC